MSKQLALVILVNVILGFLFAYANITYWTLGNGHVNYSTPTTIQVEQIPAEYGWSLMPNLPFELFWISTVINIFFMIWIQRSKKEQTSSSGIVQECTLRVDLVALFCCFWFPEFPAKLHHVPPRLEGFRTLYIRWFDEFYQCVLSENFKVNINKYGATGRIWTRINSSKNQKTTFKGRPYISYTTHVKKVLRYVP